MLQNMEDLRLGGENPTANVKVADVGAILANQTVRLIGLPQVTSVIVRTNVLSLEIPVSLVHLQSGGRLDGLMFILDGGCGVDAVIPEQVFNELTDYRFDTNDFPETTARVAGGAGVIFKVGHPLRVCMTTGRQTVRETDLLSVLIGGDSNLLGLGPMSRLGVGAALDQGDGTARQVAVFPVASSRVSIL